MSAHGMRRWLGLIAAVACAGAALAAFTPEAAAAASNKEAVARAVEFLESRQQSDGGFAEPEGRSDPTLTAWVVLGLDAADVDVARLRRGGATPAHFLMRRPYCTGRQVCKATDIELRILALTSLGQDVASPLAHLNEHHRASGRIGPFLNSTIWGILALHAAGGPVPKAAVRFLKRHQHRSGGFSWHPSGAPDTNDTAAAIQALRAAGVRARAKVIRRAIRYLSKHRRENGGFPLAAAGAPDTQSTAWVMQAFRAAGRKEPPRSRRYLKAQQQPDGSIRYRRGDVRSPVLVTAQALPALAGRPFPLSR